MSNISLAFEKVKSEGCKLFIPCITAGDPNINATERFIYALEEAGSELIELSIPFSDPVADGPVIQAANLRAMENGINIDKIFEMIERVRKNTQVPIVYLMYANTIHYYGTQRFFEKCKETGVDGVIIQDVPLEEKEEFDQYARVNGIDFIAVVAPTSKGRTKGICEKASGFLYCIAPSVGSIAKESIQVNLDQMVMEIKKYTAMPITLGYGMSNPNQLAVLKDYADGIIVESAMVEVIEKYKEESVKPLIELAKEFIAVL